MRDDKIDPGGRLFTCPVAEDCGLRAQRPFDLTDWRTMTLRRTTCDGTLFDRLRLLSCTIVVALLVSACGGSTGEAVVDLTEPGAIDTEADDTASDTADETADASDSGDAVNTDDPDEDDPDEGDPDEGDPDEGDTEPEPTPEPEPEPTATPEPAPVFWVDVLSPGDCFNPSEIAEGQPPTPTDCNELHEEEVFAVGSIDQGPDAPYPGDDELFSLADSTLCDAETTAFGGATWDVLPFPTFVIYPTEQDWAAGDRGILCTAGPREGSTLKIGSAVGGTIDTDDQLLLRTSASHPDLGEFEEFVIMGELESIDYATSLTDLNFDLPLRRPSLLAGGFMFNADVAGDTVPGNQLWTYQWEGGDVSTIELPVPDFEYASTTTLGASFVFAAREDSEGDWNLFALSQGQDVAILGDSDTDEQYPTFTPDAERVVFQRDGDLWITDIDGANQTQLTDTPANEWESAVSPDGQFVAFATDRDGNDEIYLMPIDGGEAINLTNSPADESWPTWSTDGSIMYFGTDRLAPEDDRNVVMMMRPDGTDQSWFSSFTANQALVVDPGDAELAAANYPTLDERVNFDLIEGEAGTLVEWTHTTERLRASIPAGWRITETDGNDAIAGFIAAPRPSEAAQFWSSDQITVTLFEAPNYDDFVARRFETAAPQSSCDVTDGPNESLEDPELFTLGTIFDCGGATVRVLALWDVEDGLGVLVEGQQDSFPDEQSDIDLLNELLVSVNWR